MPPPVVASKIIWIHASRVAKLIGRHPYEPRAAAVHELSAQLIGQGARVRASNRLNGTSHEQVIAAASVLGAPLADALRAAVQATVEASTATLTADTLAADMRAASHESILATHAIALEAEAAERLVDAVVAEEARVASNARAASDAARQAILSRDASDAAARAIERADFEAMRMKKVVVDRAHAKAHVERVRSREACARATEVILAQEAAKAHALAEETRLVEQRVQRDLQCVRAQVSVQVVERIDAAALASESKADGVSAHRLTSARAVMPAQVEQASRMAAGTVGERSILERARAMIPGALYSGTVPTQRIELGVVQDGAYKIMLIGVADGLTDDAVIEIKKRRARLLGVPDYEQVQCTCYMRLFNRSKALLVEEHAGKLVSHDLQYDELAWYSIRDGIVRACGDALLHDNL